MMQTYRLKTIIREDRTVTLPPEVPPGEVEILVRVERPADGARAASRDLLAYLDDLARRERPGRAREELDREIEEQRLSWA